MPPNVTLGGPALHAAAARVAQTAGPKVTGFGGKTVAGVNQRSVNSAPPPARYGAGGPQNAGLPSTAISAAKGAGQLKGAANTTAPKAPKTAAPKAPAAPSTGLTSSAFDLSQPLSGQNFQTVLNQQSQGNTNAALQPLQQNARQLTAQEQTISGRLAGYDAMYGQQLQANAAAAPAQSAGAVGQAQAAGQIGTQGISDTQAAIQAAIASSPELAGAAMDGGARQMIANEMAAQRLAQAATTGANVGYAGAVGGNSGQLSNTLAGSGIIGAQEGQSQVAGVFGRALASNTAAEQKVIAGAPAARAALYNAMRREGFTEFATLAGLGTKKVAAQVAQQNANTNAFKAQTTATNDAASRRLQASSQAITAAHNQATESIASINAQLRAQGLSETRRHDLVGERTAYLKALSAKTPSQAKQYAGLATVQSVTNEYKSALDPSIRVPGKPVPTPAEVVP